MQNNLPQNQNKASNVPIKVPKKNKKSIMDQLTDTPRKGTFTLAIGSFLIIIFMIFVAIRPAIASVIQQISSNKERKELITKQEKKMDTLKKLIDEKKQYQAEIDLLADVFPDYDDSEFVVRNIFAYSEKHDDIDITSVSIDFDHGGAEVLNLETSIQFYCDIIEATKFIEFLDSFPRIFSVQDVNYASNEGDDNSSYPIIGEVEMNVFYKVKQEALLDQD